MSLRWKRNKHWKNIRVLMDSNDTHLTVHAYIQRGRRPNEYTLVFPIGAHRWALGHLDRKGVTNTIPDYVLTHSTLAAAKAVGMLIVKTQGVQ
jgi:hypothetical protein